MRALILGALGTAVLTAAPLAASADVITVKFSIPIPAGTSNNSFPSSRIRQFDSSLGTLTDTTIALTELDDLDPRTGGRRRELVDAHRHASLWFDDSSVTDLHGRSRQTPTHRTRFAWRHLRHRTIGSPHDERGFDFRKSVAQFSRGHGDLRLHAVSFLHRGPAPNRRRSGSRALKLGDDADRLRRGRLCRVAGEARWARQTGLTQLGSYESLHRASRCCPAILTSAHQGAAGADRG